LLSEERRFRALVTRGRPIVARMRSNRVLTEDDLGYLAETHGLPSDLVLALLDEDEATG